MYDITIIGAGVIGASITRKLSKYDLKILLLESEADVSMGASKANSAIIHGGYAESHEKLKGRVCYKGRRQFKKLNDELNFGFSEIGSLVIGFNEEDKTKLEELKENGIKNGLNDLKIIKKDEILRLEPNINKNVKYALFCKGAGVCSPYELVIALVENAVENGVDLKLNSKVVDIVRNNNYYNIIIENKKIYSTKIVINCAGIKSGKISKMINEEYFSIKPRSGEYILLKRGSGDLLNHVVFQVPTKMGKGVLVTPTFHNNLLIGPDAIDEDIVNKETDINRLSDIFLQGLNTIDKLNINDFIRSFSGIRAVSDIDDFIIEETNEKNFINIAGIQSPGLTSSPEIANIVEEILKNIKDIKMIKKNNYNPYRKPIIKKKNKDDFINFEELSGKINLPSGNNKRIVCRCEEVNEETILDSMNRNIPVTTIDGVKRRTRAGMGYCQGNFCKKRVAKLISKQLGYEINSNYDIENSETKRVERKEIVDKIKNELEKNSV